MRCATGWAQAFALRSPVQAFLRGPALRVIDEVFGALSRGDEVWRCERLELDLGTVSGDDLPAVHSVFKRPLECPTRAGLPADAGPMPATMA